VLFTEPTFLFLFLPLLLALYFVPDVRRAFSPAESVHAAYGNWLLLVASIVFYAKGGGPFTWLMLASIAFNYSIAIAIDSRTCSRRPGSRASSAASPMHCAVDEPDHNGIPKHASSEVSINLKARYD